MTDRDQSRFDRWAETYDEHVEGTRGFPFVGHESAIERAAAPAEAFVIAPAC